MNRLARGLLKFRNWPALLGLPLAFSAGLAVLDTGACVLPPTAALTAPLPGLAPTMDRLAEETQSLGAADPDPLAPVLSQPSVQPRTQVAVADPAATPRIPSAQASTRVATGASLGPGGI